jgi:hypothetical protein
MKSIGIGLLVVISMISLIFLVRGRKHATHSWN